MITVTASCPQFAAQPSDSITTHEILISVTINFQSAALSMRTQSSQSATCLVTIN